MGYMVSNSGFNGLLLTDITSGLNIFCNFDKNFSNMENHPVRNGVYAGVGQILVMFLFYFIDPSLMISWSSMVGYVVVIYFMRQAAKEQRLDNGGFITLNGGFRSSWLTFVLAQTMVTIFSYLLMNYIDPSLLDVMKETQIKVLEDMNSIFKLPEEDFEKQLEAIEDTNPFSLGNVAMALPFSFVFPGALIALIIGLVMKKEEPIA
jgi:hypothetical protein